MATKKISQREAMRLRKRNKELEHTLERLKGEYAGPVIRRVTAEGAYLTTWTARLLGHIVTATTEGTDTIVLRAFNPKA